MNCELPNNIEIHSEEEIREVAYFLWLESTGGQPVSDEESQKFWTEAENRLFHTICD